VLCVRISVIVLAVTLLGAAAFQPEKKDDKPPIVKTRPPLPKGFKDLGLRDDQKAKVYKILVDYRDKVDELKAKETKLKEERDEALEKLLTPEQIKRLQEIRSGKKPAEKEPEKGKVPEKSKSADKGKD
jgi:Spy/CpxP family protein refolding chaperone